MLFWDQSIKDLPNFYIEWDGFKSDWLTLKSNGWQFKAGFNCRSKLFTVRLYNPKDHLTCLIKNPQNKSINGTTFVVEMHSGGGRNKKAKPLRIRDYSAVDINALLEIIAALQSNSRKNQIKNTNIPSADIIPLMIANS